MARRAPEGLSPRAHKVWTETTKSYEFREDELSTLVDLVQEITIVDRLQEASKDAELLVKASHGGLQINPIIQELRYRRQAVAALNKSLKLPDLDADDDEEQEPAYPGQPMTRSQSAKKAADARWGRGRGRRNA